MVKFVQKEMRLGDLNEKSSPSEKLDCILSYFRLRVHIVSFLCFFLLKENNLEFENESFVYVAAQTFIGAFNDGPLESKADMLGTIYKAEEVFLYLDAAKVVGFKKDKVVFLDDFFYLTSKEYLESFLGKDSLSESLPFIKRRYKETLEKSKGLKKLQRFS